MKLLKVLGFNKTRYSAEDEALAAAIYKIIGARPDNLNLYKLALRHSSAASEADAVGINNNERLEFLGDAILGAIVGEFLFKKYPLKDEGFLTEIRSRMVNREKMGELAHKVGIPKLLSFSQRIKGQGVNTSMHGDAMEALIGAAYLDKGFAFCQKFIIDRLVTEYVNMDDLITRESNHKSRLIEWCQRTGARISFEIVSETGRDHNKLFLIRVLINGKSMGEGKGSSKKRAEQDAAAKALEQVNPTGADSTPS